MEEVVGFVFHLDVQVQQAVPRSAWSPTVPADRPGRGAGAWRWSRTAAVGRGRSRWRTVGRAGRVRPQRAGDAGRRARDRGAEPEPEPVKTAPSPARRSPRRDSSERHARRLSYSAPGEDGTVTTTGTGPTAPSRRRPVRRRRTQRALPVWVGQEVQDVPRPSRGPLTAPERRTSDDPRNSMPRDLRLVAQAHDRRGHHGGGARRRCRHGGRICVRRTPTPVVAPPPVASSSDAHPGTGQAEPPAGAAEARSG